MHTIPADKIPFQLFGLHLQDPMALILNWVMALIAFVAFYKLRKVEHNFQKNWRWFFLFFGISTFLGGLSHTFFYYTGFYGKISSWIFNFIATFFVGKAMIEIGWIDGKLRKRLLRLLALITVVLFYLTVLFQSFTFVIVDTAIVYFPLCFGYGIYALKNNIVAMKYIVIGVCVLIPSALIFILKINPFLWYNKNDLSHTLIIISLFFFYFGVAKFVFQQKKRW